MVVRSLFTGVSGLQSHFDKMDTLSNNISNTNTPGFKQSNVVFKSFLAQQTDIATSPSGQRGGTNPQSVGLGVDVGSVNLNMSQGQLQRTGVNTDLGIQGDGFFTTRQAGSNRNLYTRAGSFQFDSNGQLVDPSNGNVVQGYNADVENGEIKELVSSGQPEDVQITEEMESIPGSATTFQDISGNLNASEDVGIDPVEVSFSQGNSSASARFEFERYHPTKKMYKFDAVWTENPPSGKQIGDSVEDKITGRNLQGIVQLNENDRVTGLFRNPDTHFGNGIAQVEADRNNAEDYTIDDELIEARDQQNLFTDLQNQDWNGEMRIQFGTDEGPDVTGPTDGAGAFTNDQYAVQWQDEEGNWNNVLENSDPTGPEVTWKGSIDPAAGSNPDDNFLERDTNGDGNVDRVGELEFKDNFISETTAAEGDKVYFSIDGAINGDNGNGLLNRSGEEVKEEFRWAGTGDEIMRMSDAEGAPDNSTDDGSLDRVFNYDETSALTNLSNSTSINDLENKEFVVQFTSPTEYEVFTDTSGNGQVGNGDLSAGGFNPTPGPPAANDSQLQGQTERGGTLGTTFSINDDVQLFDNSDNELGISISSEDWSGSFGGGDVFKFTATEGRSTGSDGRGFSVVQDGGGNLSSLFMPQDPDDGGANINFAPNQEDESTTLLENTQASGAGATASVKDPETIQTVASSDVFDSLGEQHTLNYTFEKQDENEWIWHAKDPAPTDPQNADIAGFGKVSFNENGQVDEVQNFASKVPQQFPPPGPGGDLDNENGVYFNPPESQLQSDPSAPDTLNQDIGASPVRISPNFDNVSQFGGESNLEIADQDGTANGQLSSLNFDQTGKVQGSYDNGEQRELAQIAITQFQNPEGLSKEGSTYFTESANSGIAQFGTAGSGGRGSITPGALERSNVELSSQFTRVISTQRGFQANTRTITTSDQMVQSVLQLI